MKRATTLAALAMSAGLAAPALANEQLSPTAALGDTPSVTSFTAQLAWRANQQQFRKFLAHQGYIVTSDLNRIDSGHWVGTALKDGEAVRIALKMPPRDKVVPLTN